ncbi:MAG: 2-C-methyl-D-erythritol 4-phosphate cytidylyltransferase [Massilibacteroides sp.]|nr:2-C-methyl-D-erythritol 4-phosphate cytidylyltransferase [Massilibacteroides sp.]MDD3062077.1 2-C-methyl-D-erythritol 4-phosphate cytidylyltransferase [Massilibacteroides sp.]MDD4114099.1 2-C-methyl-D-erythritol 4-phosphate cytidylyltransferase [Massilibacteroides sp.]MDD4659621.1 2-C-methyl-D-erythritol 4-phosphate cytidylyltransferase [Massilibacteroides sp.]
MKNYVLIVAGGKGLRMGHDLPKQFIPLAGKPLLMHTMQVFYRWNATAEILLVLPESHQDYWAMLCRELKFVVPHKIVTGGETRFHSVRNGLNEVRENGLVAVHDGVRPFVRQEMISACFSEAAFSGAAIPVVPVVDSLRIREGEKSKPVDRNLYCIVQTPQVFVSTLLLAAYQQPWQEIFTDDASVVEAAGGRVALVEGDRENIKITTQADLLYAKMLLETET